MAINHANVTLKELEERLRTTFHGHELSGEDARFEGAELATHF